MVQGIGSVGATPVIYSMGNLMFGGTIDLTTFDAMLGQLRLRFREGEYVGVTVELIPILTSGQAPEDVNDYSPVIAQGADRERILQKGQDDTPFPLMYAMYWPAN